MASRRPESISSSCPRSAEAVARGRRQRLRRRRGRSCRETSQRERRVEGAGPAARSQLLRANFVCEIAACDPAASLRAIASARSSSSSAGTHSETRPIRSASTPSTGSHRSKWYFAFREPAQQRPYQDGVVAGGDPEPRVAVDDPRRRSRDADVREERDRKASADCGAVDGRDDRLAAVHDVVDEVARLVEHADSRLPVRRDVLDEFEIAAGAEGAVCAADDPGTTRVSGSRSTVCHTAARWPCASLPTAFSLPGLRSVIRRIHFSGRSSSRLVNSSYTWRSLTFSSSATAASASCS